MLVGAKEIIMNKHLETINNIDNLYKLAKEFGVEIDGSQLNVLDKQREQAASDGLFDAASRFLKEEAKRSKKVDIPTEQWQKSIERRLDALENPQQETTELPLMVYLRESGYAKSSSVGRQMILGGYIYVNGAVESDPKAKVDPNIDDIELGAGAWIFEN